MKLPHLFHNWFSNGYKMVTDLKAGPYDPRTDQDRTYAQDMEICAVCGKERRTPSYDYGYPG